jgi:hypothetical protein
MTGRARLMGCAVLLMALATGACGGGSMSEFEGIYQANSWTRNDTACDTEGASILETAFETDFYIKEENFLGAKFLNVKFCADQADCEMLASDSETIHLGMWGFDRGSDGNGWTSEFYSGFPDTNNLCQGEFVTTKMTGMSGQSVRIEVREVTAGGFAPDSDGFCDDDAGKAAAEGQPCTSLEVMTANFTAELP